MIPRITTYEGLPVRSACPFCGDIYKNFEEENRILDYIYAAVSFLIIITIIGIVIDSLIQAFFK